MKISWIHSPKKLTYLLLFFGLCMGVFGARSSLDIKLFYTGAEADAFLQALSVEEIQSYFRNELIDFGFMFAYSLLFLALMRKFYPHARTIAYLALIPGLVDVVENSTIIYLLFNLDSAKAPWWLGYITCIKWSTGILVVGSLIYGKFSLRKT